MPRIAISYRRSDSEEITGRIFDRLATHYGRDAVFRDIDSIPAGVDFRTHVGSELDKADIVLVIVGPRWVGPRASHSRLDDAGDPVRVEVETALGKNVPLIPVLVMRAAMPSVAQLPETLRNFAYHNAVTVDGGQDFDFHIGRLIRSMDMILQQKYGAGAVRPLQIASENASEAAPPPFEVAGAPAAAVPRRLPAILGFAAGALLGVIAAIAILFAVKPPWLAPPAILQDLAAEKAANVTVQAQLDQTAKQLTNQKDAAAQAQSQADQLAAQVKTLTGQLAALQVPANRVVAFSLPDYPQKGARDFWFYTVAGIWVERSSDGKTYNEFQTKEPLTVDSCPGMKLTSRRGAQIVQVFVPDRGCPNMSAQILNSPPGVNPYWILLGKMDDIAVGNGR
jgi:hypothetical protein